MLGKYQLQCIAAGQDTITQGKAKMTVKGMKTVLVIDDDREIREWVMAVLESRGYYVLEAENAIRANELLGTESVDLIVLDVMMPWLDGLSLLEAVQTSRKTSAPVIVFTSRQDERIRAKALACGASDFILKPIKASEFLECVRKHLQ